MVTALPDVAESVGAMRILKGVAITNPVGYTGISPEEEKIRRKELLQKALDLLSADIKEQVIIR